MFLVKQQRPKKPCACGILRTLTETPGITEKHFRGLPHRLPGHEVDVGGAEKHQRRPLLSQLLGRILSFLESESLLACNVWCLPKTIQAMYDHGIRTIHD